MQPLNQNQWQVTAGFGGPIIDEDSKIQPVPLSSVSVAYGVSQSFTAFAGIDPSSSVEGVYHMDTGFSHELITPFDRQPGVTYSIDLNAFFDKQESNFKLYPQLDINAYWLLPFRNDFFYIGMSNWFELASKKAHQRTQETRWIPGFHTGYTLQYDKYGFSLEMKYIAPFSSNQNLLINYISPTNKGTLGAYLSMSRKF